MKPRLVLWTALFLPHLLFAGYFSPERVALHENQNNVFIDNFDNDNRINVFSGKWEAGNDSYFNGNSSIRITMIQREKGNAALKADYNLGPAFNSRFVTLRAGFAASFDARKYKGIRLSLKGSKMPLRVEIGTANITDYDYFGFVIQNTPEEIKTVDILFADCIQEGWGNRSEMDLARISSLQFKPCSQVPRESGFFIIDDIQFITNSESKTAKRTNILSMNQNPIRLNQLGYRPDDLKVAVILKDVAWISVKNLGNSISKIIQVTRKKDGLDQISGQIIYEADFSSIKEPGRYFCELPDGTRSYTFEIKKSVYDRVFVESMRFYYYQRCGTALKKEYAGAFSRPPCHMGDFNCGFHESTGKKGRIDVHGGWHDAGDYGKYVVNSGISVGTLFNIYDLFRNSNLFSDNQLDIPESGNKIPDILDEVRYNVEWILRMQDTDGGVFHKLSANEFSAFVMPNEDFKVTYIMPKSSCATADFAAMTAIAARLFKKFDPLFAQTCLRASLNAWNWLDLHPEVFPPGGWRNPSGVGTGDYFDSNDQDERFWAAAELFRTTDNQLFHAYFIKHYNQYANNRALSGNIEWFKLGLFGLYSYLMNDSKKAEPDIQADIRGKIVVAADKLLKRISDDGYGVPMLPDDYIWGSNGVLLNYAMILCYAHHETSDAKYWNGVISILSYVFGRNAVDYSFVTGFGEHSSRNPHHRPSQSDGIPHPIPGMVVGGPNHNRQDSITALQFNGNSPISTVYADNPASFSCNEVTINWNAPLVFVLGYVEGVSHQSNIAFNKEWFDRTQNGEAGYNTSEAGKKKYSIVKASGAIPVDGIFSNHWSNSEEMLLSENSIAPQNIIGEWKGDSDCSGEIRFLWDEKSLYIFAKIKDNVPMINNKTGGDIYNGDGIDIYFNTDISKLLPVGYSSSDFQITISAKGSMWIYGQTEGGKRNGPPENSTVKTLQTKDGYIIEARISIDNFGTTSFASGKKIGLDVAINDDDGSGRKCQMIWNGNKENYANSYGWGIGIFK